MWLCTVSPFCSSDLRSTMWWARYRFTWEPESGGPSLWLCSATPKRGVAMDACLNLGCRRPEFSQVSSGPSGSAFCFYG